MIPPPLIVLMFDLVFVVSLLGSCCYDCRCCWYTAMKRGVFGTFCNFHGMDGHEDGSESEVVQILFNNS